MWMLMTAEGCRQTAIHTPRPVELAAPVASGLRQEIKGLEFEARVFLHPGRALVGRMSAERLLGQFDLGEAPGFENLGAAELAADGRPGFLVEVGSGFVDAQGARHERAVFFIPRLESAARD